MDEPDLRFKHIPNALSIARIFLTLSLFLVLKPDQKIWFTLIYLACGATDILDGWIARKYHVESKLGGQLDGTADILVFIVSFVCCVWLLRLDIDVPKILITAILPIAFKAFNFALIWKRFHMWNGIHTYTFKTIGALLFFSILVFLWMNEVNYWVVLAMLSVVFLACAEEAYIVMKSSEFDVDDPGLLVKWLKKHKS